MEQLQNIVSEINQLLRDTITSFGHLSTEQINWKPNAKIWSIGQCFDHLIVTNNLYFSNIQKVIDGTHRNNFFSKIPFGVDLIGALMKNSLNPNQRRKMKTFKVFEPSVGNIPTSIIDEFAENNRKLITMIEAVKDIDIHKIKIAEPLSIALNLRLDAAFEILAMHEKRHFNQAKRVLAMKN